MEHKGFKKRFSDELFLNALSDNQQTTSQIAKKVGCAHDTASALHLNSILHLIY